MELVSQEAGTRLGFALLQAYCPAWHICVEGRIPGGDTRFDIEVFAGTRTEGESAVWGKIEAFCNSHNIDFVMTDWTFLHDLVIRRGN